MLKTKLPRDKKLRLSKATLKTLTIRVRSGVQAGGTEGGCRSNTDCPNYPRCVDTTYR